MFEALIYAVLGFCLLAILIRMFLFFRASGKFRAVFTDQAWQSRKFTPFRMLFQLLLQYRLFIAGKSRWTAHFFVFSGFIYLIFIHGLHRFTSTNWFLDYQPTLDPFQWLRNLGAVMVVCGTLFFLFRRFSSARINRDKRFQFRGMISVALVAFAVISGVLLETGKMVSEPVFNEMVEEYTDLVSGEEDLDDLKMLWHQRYGVGFESPPQITAAGIENGIVVNESYCLYCHSDSRSAFLSIRLAKLIRDHSGLLNRFRADHVMYIIHLGACLLLLLVLPFSKMFHVLAIPLTSLRRPSNAALPQHTLPKISVSDLWACTGCGFCSEVCSVFPHFQVTGNWDALPHSKVDALKRIVSQERAFNPFRFQQGNGFCTKCGRCTRICPSGIDLQSLWAGADVFLDKSSILNTSAFFLDQWSGEENFPEIGEMHLHDPQEVDTGLVSASDDFENCIQCTVCTNVCPVVDHDGAGNDYTPQQVMNLLRLGLDREAASSRMVWTCLTCYACQEACPQGIRVTDVLLELRCKADGKTRRHQARLLKESHA